MKPWIERGITLTGALWAVFLLWVPSAFAAPTYRVAPLDLEGVWTFETDEFNERACYISGEVRIFPTERARVYLGEMTAQERCEQTERIIVTEQSSEFRQINLAVRVRSSVMKVSPPVPYNPDHFDLRIVNDDMLVGLLDTNVHARVEFHRINNDPEAQIE